VSTDTDAELEALHSAIQANGDPSLPGALLSHWIIIAEWVDDEGEPWLSRRSSENMTTWLRRGMLHDALDEATWK
jgi:hypothetical protein